MTRIIVIDDEEDLRALLQQALERAGYDVVLAANGAAGLALHRAHSADLVITDIFMPDKEGIETIRELKQEFPKLRIIAMSGRGNLGKLDYLSMASELGALSVLQKPFDAKTLLESVQEALRVPGG